MHFFLQKRLLQKTSSEALLPEESKNLPRKEGEFLEDLFSSATEIAAKKEAFHEEIREQIESGTTMSRGGQREWYHRRIGEILSTASDAQTLEAAKQRIQNMLDFFGEEAEQHTRALQSKLEILEAQGLITREFREKELTDITESILQNDRLSVAEMRHMLEQKSQELSTTETALKQSKKQKGTITDLLEKTFSIQKGKQTFDLFTTKEREEAAAELDAELAAAMSNEKDPSEVLKGFKKKHKQMKAEAQKRQRLQQQIQKGPVKMMKRAFRQHWIPSLSGYVRSRQDLQRLKAKGVKWQQPYLEYLLATVAGGAGYEGNIAIATQGTIDHLSERFAEGKELPRKKSALVFRKLLKEIGKIPSQIMGESKELRQLAKAITGEYIAALQPNTALEKIREQCRTAEQFLEPEEMHEAYADILHELDLLETENPELLQDIETERASVLHSQRKLAETHDIDASEKKSSQSDDQKKSISELELSEKYGLIDRYLQQECPGWSFPLMCAIRSRRIKQKEGIADISHEMSFAEADEYSQENLGASMSGNSAANDNVESSEKNERIAEWDMVRGFQNGESAGGLAGFGKVVQRGVDTRFTKGAIANDNHVNILRAGKAITLEYLIMLVTRGIRAVMPKEFDMNTISGYVVYFRQQMESKRLAEEWVLASERGRYTKQAANDIEQMAA